MGMNGKKLYIEEHQEWMFVQNVKNYCLIKIKEVTTWTKFSA